MLTANVDIYVSTKRCFSPAKKSLSNVLEDGEFFRRWAISLDQTFRLIGTCQEINLVRGGRQARGSRNNQICFHQPVAHVSRGNTC